MMSTRGRCIINEVGLFSPRSRGGNGYRYYDASQSLEFEYIRMLRDLGFGVEEIKDYVSHSGERRFVAVLTRLRDEVRERKERLERLEKFWIGRPDIWRIANRCPRIASRSFTGRRRRC